jgi:protein involved in polysaccharide export with SLBB domain
LLRQQRIVIAKAGSLIKRTVTVKLDLLEKGDESQNVLLEDMDIVMVRAYSEFFERPRWVTISGEVRYPGTYPLLRKDYRLSELLEQAGGLTKTANPKGAVFLRKRELLPSLEQKGDLLAINRIVNALNDIDAKRLSARNMLLLQMERGVEATGQGPAVGAGTVQRPARPRKMPRAQPRPSIAQAPAVTGGIVSAFTPGGAMTSQARTLSDEQLSQSARIIVDVRAAMAGGDNSENTVLMSGDSIAIPQRTETASVVGAVMNPVTVHMGKNRKVENMVSLAGGYASDADEERVLVLRADGSIMPAEDIADVEEGDILYVPTGRCHGNHNHNGQDRQRDQVHARDRRGGYRLFGADTVTKKRVPGSWLMVRGKT